MDSITITRMGNGVRVQHGPDINHLYPTELDAAAGVAHILKPGSDDALRRVREYLSDRHETVTTITFERHGGVCYPSFGLYGF